MKKILLPFLLFACLAANAAIPGIVNYFSISPWSGMPPYDDNNKMIYWEVLECQPNELQIEFEIADEYKIAGNTNAQIFFNTPTSITIDVINNINGDFFNVLNSSNTIICTVQLLKAPNDLYAIHIDSYNNNIKGDTLYICSDFGTNPLDVTYDVNYSFSSNCFQDDFEAKIYINNVALDTKEWSEMNLKTGDTLYVKRSYGFIPCHCGIFQYENELTTNSYIIKILDNEITPVTDLVAGNTTICPSDTVILGQTTTTTLDYRWYKNNSTSYYSSKDTITVNTPGTFRMAQYNTPKGNCPAISPEIEVKKGTNCKGFINGYVYEQGSYNSTTKKYHAFEGVTVKTNNGLVTVSDENGYYQFQFDSIMDNQINRVYVADPEYYASNTSIYTDNNFMLDLNNSLYTYLLETNDLAVQLNSTRNRPGFTMPYYVSVENRGKNSLTTTVAVTLDGNLNYTPLNGENTPTSTTGKTLTWTNVMVESGTTKRLTFYAILDRKTALGTELVNTAQLTMPIADDVPTNDTTTFIATVTGSFDPNDKLVTYVGAFTEGYIYDSTNFEYTIRFQNSGTDTAFTVRVEDVISKNLDLTTINVLDASHNYRMSISGDTVIWLFNNILLPDSNVNEPASHGFIRFAINQKEGNTQGTIIKNKAFIYFDFNDPIITNEVVSIVDNDIVTSIEKERKQLPQSNVSVYPNPANTSISINAEGTGSVELYNSTGALVLKTSNKNKISIDGLKTGIYYYQFITDGNIFSGSFVKE